MMKLKLEKQLREQKPTEITAERNGKIRVWREDFTRERRRTRKRIEGAER